MTYIIEIDGETYSVCAAYSDGSGTLEVHGAKGTWNCTYSNGGGGCAGSGANFTF